MRSSSYSTPGREGSPPIICNMAFYHSASRRGKKRQGEEEEEDEEEVGREAAEMLTVGETLEV